MALRIALIGACEEDALVGRWLERPLVLRGDTVRRFPLDFRRGALASTAVLASLELAQAHPDERFGLVVWCGAPTLGLLAGPLLRLQGAPSIYVVGPGTERLNRVERLAAHLADQAVARDLVGYRALLAAEVPTYRAGLVQDAPDPRLFAAREAEPQAKDRWELIAQVTPPAGASLAADASSAAEAVAEVLRQQSKVHATIWASDAAAAILEAGLGTLAGRATVGSVPSDPSLRAEALASAHLLFSVGADEIQRREASAIGLGAITGEELPAARWANELGRTLKDNKLRQAAHDRAKAKDLETGYPALERAWLRIVDRVAG